jgi:hypothetical protein
VVGPRVVGRHRYARLPGRDARAPRLRGEQSWLAHWLRHSDPLPRRPFAGHMDVPGRRRDRASECLRLLTRGVGQGWQAQTANRELAKCRSCFPTSSSETSRSACVGRKTLEAGAAPGHSPDGIGVLLMEDRVLFSRRRHDAAAVPGRRSNRDERRQPAQIPRMKLEIWSGTRRGYPAARSRMPCEAIWLTWRPRPLRPPAASAEEPEPLVRRTGRRGIRQEPNP